jgi:hypothetical protein
MLGRQLFASLALALHEKEFASMLTCKHTRSQREMQTTKNIRLHHKKHLTFAPQQEHSCFWQPSREHSSTCLQAVQNSYPHLSHDHSRRSEDISSSKVWQRWQARWKKKGTRKMRELHQNPERRHQRFADASGAAQFTTNACTLARLHGGKQGEHLSSTDPPGKQSAPAQGRQDRWISVSLPSHLLLQHQAPYHPHVPSSHGSRHSHIGRQTSVRNPRTLRPCNHHHHPCSIGQIQSIAHTR